MDELCDVHGDWASIDLVMRDWRRTHSPLAHWYNQLAGSDARHWADVREDFDEDSLAGKTNLTYGLPQASCAQNSSDKKSRNTSKEIQGDHTDQSDRHEGWVDLDFPGWLPSE